MVLDGVEFSSSSGWIDPPMDIQPPLDAGIECDVAVAGGGLGGMATALHLSERGLDVVLLEAAFCGAGASSRNAGQVAGGPGGDIQLLNLLYRRRMPGLVRYAENAALFLERLMDRLDIECEYERTGNIGVAVSKGQMGRVRRVGKILDRAGANVRVGEADELGIPRRFRGGLHERVGGVLNPGMLTRAVRAAVIASTTRVFERTPALEVMPSADGVAVSTPHGLVRARDLVLATNAYGGSLGVVPKRVATPIWVTEVETEPIEPHRLAALDWTSRAGLVTQHAVMENYRLTARNTIVFGVRKLEGGAPPLPERTPSYAVVDSLIEGFRSRFPTLAEVQPARTWGGWIAVTPTWLPVAGKAADHVYYSIPCNGHGLAQAPYVGTMIAQLVAVDAMHDDLRVIWSDKSTFGRSPAMTTPGLALVYAYDRLADRLNGSLRRA